MTSRQAVILAGALAAVILILLIPVWRGVAWSDEVVEDDSQQPATKVAVEATPEDNEDTASGWRGKSRGKSQQWKFHR